MYRRGWILDASDSIIRGLAIEGFGIGISIPNPDRRGRPDPGKLHRRFVWPIRSIRQTGDPLPTPETVVLAGPANTQEGILLGSDNATVGGLNPNETTSSPATEPRAS